MWWVIAFIWFFILVILITGCAPAGPMASYRDPVTGQLCWGRLDAETLTCAKEGK
jgi:hypothetical protein